MELKSITVQRYRSISTAKKIDIGRSTVLVGPNNEGKSNILRALVMAMNFLTFEGRARIRPSSMFYSRSRLYDWDRDYPLHLQKESRAGSSSVVLEFSLTGEELQEFKREIRSNLTGTLPIKITLGDRESEIRVFKKGRGAVTLSRKSRKIARFIAQRLDIQYISAVRTAKSAQSTVGDMVGGLLLRLEQNDEYQAALTKIRELQNPLLEELSGNVRQSLVQFLPAIRDISIQITDEERSRALRRACQIHVDDGTRTLLEQKGDGVQSLIALGLTRYEMESGSGGRNLILAVEEPESHLHPEAMHEVKQVLSELAEEHQVVVTTHNPLFVDRSNIGANIIVRNKKAVPAKTVQEVRQTLGVRASDNLMHASLVVLVEGESDRIALPAVLGEYSGAIASAITSNVVAFETMQGASNLNYQLSLLRSSLCFTHVVLDNDKAGCDAFESAKAAKLLRDSDVDFLMVEGKAESEIEDLYAPDLYRDLVMDKYNVSLASPKFRKNSKWSCRVREVFRQQNRMWNESIEKQLKVSIAKLVSTSPADAVAERFKDNVKVLASHIEERLEAARQAEQKGGG